MEDRYLFRAKRADNGEWVVWNALTGIPHDISIIQDTICQCTGLKDKNGKLIWENDIVKDLFSDACARTKTEHVGFYVDWSGKCTKRYRKDLGYWINMVNAEVIGNIFDNAGLLESEG